MKITYIHHSAFLVETESAYLLPGSIRERRKVRIHLILKICKDLVRLCTGKSEIGSGSFGKRGDRLQVFLHPVRQRSFQLFDRTIGETGT